MTQVYFKTPVDIYELKKTYSDDVEFLSDTTIFPLIKGISFEGSLNKVIKGKKKLLNIKDRVDRLLELYKRKLFRAWDDHVEQIINNEPIKKADEESDKRKEVIAGILASLGIALGQSAVDYYKQAYLLGKQRGVSISGKEFRQVISEAAKDKIATLKDKNQAFVDNFMNDLNTKYSEALDREYATQEAQDNEIKRITATAEARLRLYVPAVLAALAFGLNEGLFEGTKPSEDGAPVLDEELPEELTGIIWITNHDDNVCPGCAENDGKFFTFDEFEEEYQSNECISNCRCAETSEPTSSPREHFARSARVENLQKGGPGSGCQGPNCGRPSTGGSEFTLRTKYKNSFKFNDKDPVKTISSSGKVIDKFVVTQENEFIPVHSTEPHAYALADNGIKNYDAQTRVIQDLDRKVAFIRLGHPNDKVINAAVIDGDDRAMKMIIERQRQIAAKLYDKHPGMTIILASGGTPRIHNNNLPRDIDSGSEIPDKPQTLVNKEFIYRT